MIYLSFDIEEFDVPREKGLDISLADSMKISKLGTKKILDILANNQVKATLFCTSKFVKNAPKIIKRAIKEGHEIAAHGCDHWKPKADDPKRSKNIIEKQIKQKVFGYRQPRMFKVDDNLIQDCGYTYNSSLNPAFIPGKYVHLDVPRTAFYKGKVLQIPASVSPYARIPMFWLALHNYPLSMYFKIADAILKKDDYFMTYFHPWEFVNHPANIRKYMLPIVNHNNGQNMCDRLDALIKHFKAQGQEFDVLRNFVIRFKKEEINGCKFNNSMSLL